MMVFGPGNGGVCLRSTAAAFAAAFPTASSSTVNSLPSGTYSTSAHLPTADRALKSYVTDFAHAAAKSSAGANATALYPFGSKRCVYLFYSAAFIFLPSPSHSTFSV